jgi:hypothetical protein
VDWPRGITPSTQWLPRLVDRDSVLRKHRDRIWGSCTILSNKCYCTDSSTREKRSETEPKKPGPFGAHIRYIICRYKLVPNGGTTHSLDLTLKDFHNGVLRRDRYFGYHPMSQARKPTGNVSENGSVSVFESARTAEESAFVSYLSFFTLRRSTMSKM